MKVILASNNPSKIHELKSLLQPRQIDFIPQAELNIEDAEETAETFVENALLKARHAALLSGLPAISDDSGLCVAALNDAPGIFSARYAGVKAMAADNIQKLLHALKDVPIAKRQAFFYCALVFVRHAKDPTPIICCGQWQGTILTEPRGTAGFGYDPIFFDEEQRLSAAELTKEIKNCISHRGQALQKLLEEFTHARVVC